MIPAGMLDFTKNDAAASSQLRPTRNRRSHRAQNVSMHSGNPTLNRATPAAATNSHRAHCSRTVFRELIWPNSILRTKPAADDTVRPDLSLRPTLDRWWGVASVIFNDLRRLVSRSGSPPRSEVLREPMPQRRCYPLPRQSAVCRAFSAGHTMSRCAAGPAASRQTYF